MTDLDQIQTISSDELTLMQNRINKELEKRSGQDIDIKKIRAQVYKLAKSLGCEWLADSNPGDSTEDTDKPKRRGRKPKTDQTTETQGTSETKLQEATAHVGDTPVEEEKRKSLWPL
ncbi:MAG: hypothetical protein ACRD5H_04790 [Nitrososphaerales archaeon]